MSLSGRVSSLATRIGQEIKSLWTVIGGKQATLVSGTNIKTVNSQSLLGSGDITISGAGAVTPITVTADANNISTLNLSLGNYFKANLAPIVDTVGTVVYTDIVVVGTQGSNFGAGTSGSIAYPSGVQDGDIIVLIIGSDGAAPSLPSGFTNIANLTSGTEYTRVCYRRRVTGDGPSQSALSIATASCALAIAFRNVHTDVFDATATTATGATGLPNAPAITTATANALVVAIGLLDDDNVTPTVPAGYSNFASQLSSTVGQTVMVATKLIATPAAEDPAAFGGTGNDEWVGVTLAFKRKSEIVYAPTVYPQIAVSNVPANVVTEVKLHLTSTTNQITYPVSWNMNWKPDFSLYPDILLRLLTDNSGTAFFVASDIPFDEFIDVSAITASNIDWSKGAIFTKTLTVDTTFTMSNLRLNKVITLILSGYVNVYFPSYCRKLSGTYDPNATNYIQLHCVSRTSGSEQVWYSISKEG
jgi:hypothetical protein